jgi:hypothetical protein
MTEICHCVGKNLLRVAINVTTWLIVAAIGAAALGTKITSLAVLVAIIFYFTDIYLVDGAVVWYLARIFGSKKGYGKHTGFVGCWKPPVLTLQIFAVILAMKGLTSTALYYATLLLELAMFYITFTKVHKLSAKRATAIVIIIAVAMAIGFRYDEMASLISEVTR